MEMFVWTNCPDTENVIEEAASVVTSPKLKNLMLMNIFMGFIFISISSYLKCIFLVVAGATFNFEDCNNNTNF
jgi:hypothetical protein